MIILWKSRIPSFKYNIKILEFILFYSSRLFNICILNTEVVIVMASDAESPKRFVKTNYECVNQKNLAHKVNDSTLRRRQLHTDWLKKSKYKTTSYCYIYEFTSQRLIETPCYLRICQKFLSTSVTKNCLNPRTYLI